MRTIKFRGWHKQSRKMYLLDKIIHFRLDTLNKQKGWIFQQYTGINDKNSVEIYEGDIVRFEDVGEEGYEYKEAFDFTNRACVCWNNGRFELEKIVYDNSAMLEYMYNSHEEFINEFKGFEVIGNVYENPELLEQ